VGRWPPQARAEGAQLVQQRLGEFETRLGVRVDALAAGSGELLERKGLLPPQPCRGQQRGQDGELEQGAAGEADAGQGCGGHALLIYTLAAGRRLRP
jgi:hypothetical protein